MQKSDQIDQLAAALSEAMPEIQDAEKTKRNPAYNSAYAPLSAVIDACKPALTKHGLALSQVFEESEPGTLRLTTLLMHKSGQWLAGTCSIPLSRNDAQGYGSCATYARRYGIMGILSIAPDDDDDGNAAVQPARQGRQEAAPRPANPPRREPQPESRGDQRAREVVKAQEQPPRTLITPPLTEGGVGCKIKIERIKALWLEIGGDPNDIGSLFSELGRFVPGITNLRKADDEDLDRCIAGLEGLKKAKQEAAGARQPEPGTNAQLAGL